MNAGRSLIVHCIGPDPVRPGPTLTGSLSIAEPQAWFATLSSIRGRLDRYRALLDPEELARAGRFRLATDRARYILGHGLLRVLLGHQISCSPGELVLGRGEFGKPFIEGHPVHFNLSDTKDAVLVAISPYPIGADVETMNRNTDHERVAGHYFTPQEVESISEAADGKRRFLELWTRKEAVLKACGVGLMDDLHSLNVGGTFNKMMISHPDFVRLAGMEYHVRTASVGPDHLVSLAAEVPFDVQWIEA